MPSEQRFTGIGFDCWYGEPALMPTAHRHDDIEINFITHGTMTYWHSGGRVTLSPHHCAVFWGAIPHQLVETAPNTRFYWLTIPLDWFFRWRLPPKMSEAVLNGAFLWDATRTEWEKEVFARWLNDKNVRHPHHQDVMLMEIEARLARLALFMNVAEVHVSSINSTAEAIAQYIAQHYPEPIGASQIAHALNLHPNYAMRVFQQAFGRSMGETLTQYRLSHAQRLLVTTDQSVLDIALSAGFGSLSRFYAVFKARCGQAPKTYREKLSRL